MTFSRRQRLVTLEDASRWVIAVPHGIQVLVDPAGTRQGAALDVAEPNVDAVEGVADIPVPNCIGRRLSRYPCRIPWAPLERPADVGLGSTCAQTQTSRRDDARQQCPGDDAFRCEFGYMFRFLFMVGSLFVRRRPRSRRRCGQYRPWGSLPIPTSCVSQQILTRCDVRGM